MTADGNALANEARNSILNVDEAVQSRGIPPAALVAAESLLRTDAAAGFGQSRRDWRESEARRQRGILASAAESIVLAGRALADEGEHLVHGDQENGLAHKATNNARFGFVLDQDEFDEHRRLSPRPALPSEYLWRIGLQNVVFGDAIRLEGISKGSEGVPSIHTAQPWVDGTAPTLEEIAAFMESAGFTQIPREMFAKRVAKNLAWYRAADGVLVYDAKPSNFLKSAEGEIDPIDLVISLYPKEFLEDTARRVG
ncbi:MAG: hypothetical protein ACKV19_20510 [Verrucomicrobiales bacterium]